MRSRSFLRLAFVPATALALFATAQAAPPASPVLARPGLVQPAAMAALKVQPLAASLAAKSSQAELVANAPVFRRTAPAAVRADLARRFPLRRNYQAFKQFKNLTFQGKGPEDMAATLKRLPVLAYRPALAVTLQPSIHFLRLYSPAIYPKGKVALVVQAALNAPCSANLSRYVDDLAAQGFFAQIHVWNGGSAIDLKNLLRGINDLAGAILVGNVAQAWFEMADDFHGYAEFPIDLFLMDFDGTWTDADGDGKYNAHTGAVEPEIWVARWPVHVLQGQDPAARLNAWLNKNHAYRMGQLGYGTTAHAFDDNDWAGTGTAGLELMFAPGFVTATTDPAQTTAANYRTQVKRNYAWFHLMAHSSPWGHEWHDNQGNMGWNEVASTLAPRAAFYQLFCCSSQRYTENNFIGGQYVFGPTHNGMATVGSTKTGSMKAFEQFYGPMGNGAYLGEAFRDWFTAQAPYDLHDRGWYYGMAIVGDPCASWTTPIRPGLVSPANGQVFNHYPRATTLQWSSLNQPGFDLFKYEVQVDYKDTGWTSDQGRSYIRVGNLNATSYTFNFVGMQEGRWRVRAVTKAHNIPCAWTEWRTFRYTR